MGIIHLTPHAPNMVNAEPPDSGAGAPEITPAMIEAGADMLWSLTDIGPTAAKELAAEVLRRALAARR
jgi:hypothetical protein